MTPAALTELLDSDAVARFDQRVDHALDHLRGHPLADRCFVILTKAAEFSMLWHAAGLARWALKGRSGAREAAVVAVSLGAESLLINQGIKPLVRRPRPQVAGDERHRLRTPTTSSFPSGHASSGAFAATLLTALDGPRSRWLWWPLAALVAISRPYVRVHHGSDIVAGAIIGRLLGVGVRRVTRTLLATAH